jgi:ssDNA-binding Zn-finger/Zn-ribbon topoisomerase 1
MSWFSAGCSNYPRGETTGWTDLHTECERGRWGQIAMSRWRWPKGTWEEKCPEVEDEPMEQCPTHIARSKQRFPRIQVNGQPVLPRGNAL